MLRGASDSESISEAVLQQIMVNNPGRFLAFVAETAA
jgi:hypothetical protein